MSKYSRKNKISDETKDEAQKIALGTQRPGQTKEQTRLIAQGIQKGIDQYKKQQKVKARELNKKLKKVSASSISGDISDNDTLEPVAAESNKLPWILLTLSWLGFIIYFMVTK